MSRNINPYNQSSENFFQYPRALIEQERYKHLTHTERTVYMILMNKAKLSAKNNNKNFINPKTQEMFIYYTQEKMGNYIGLSVRSVQTIYKNLEKAGLIVREEHFNGIKRIHRIYVNEPEKEMPKEEEPEESFTEE